MMERNTESAQLSKYGDVGRGNNLADFFNALRNEFYNMDHKYRGKALIFSHDIYDIQLGLGPRDGNDKDWQRLEKCLKQLSFSVDVFHNLKYAEIMKQIEQTSKMDHSKNDCLLIVVLTHGESHAYLYARDTHYKAEDLWCLFTDKNCPTLAGKPKLFIFQACQGEKVDNGITLTTNRTEADGWFKPHKVPFHRDFLLALSTVPGYLSWRHSDIGSWFIQELCEELELLEYSTTEIDILTLLTYVSQKVALNYESRKTEKAIYLYKREVPYFSSMLTRRLVFTKKTDSSISHVGHKPQDKEEEVSHGEGPLPKSGMTQAVSNSSTSSSMNSFFGYFSTCFGFEMF